MAFVFVAIPVLMLDFSVDTAHWPAAALQQRVVITTGSYDHAVDGVALTLNRLAAHLLRQGHEVLALSPGLSLSLSLGLGLILSVSLGLGLSLNLSLDLSLSLSLRLDLDLNRCPHRPAPPYRRATPATHLRPSAPRDLIGAGARAQPVPHHVDTSPVRPASAAPCG